MMRISLSSPALIAVRNLLAGSRPTQRSGRNRGRRSFRLEQLEPRMMLDAGLTALLPDLIASSDTGSSDTDRLTSDRTPILSGTVEGPVTMVRLFTNGKPGGLLPVTDGTWTYTVPAEAALSHGAHTFSVRPLQAPGIRGKNSPPLTVRVVTRPAAAPRLMLASATDTGTKGDGRTIVNDPTVEGLAPRNQWVNVSVDGVLAGRVKSSETGAWSFKLPSLPNGSHDVTAVVENRAGLLSTATSLELEIDGKRTVMLDSSSGETIELMASHLVGQGSQGFVVTKVHDGTLEKWFPDRNAWKTIPRGDAVWANVLTATTFPARTISFGDRIRWTPNPSARGIGAAFEIVPLDKAGGATAEIPDPEARTVPGRLGAPSIDYTDGVGTKVTWASPALTDGCGCPSTRYSIEVTREDGQTLLYNLRRGIGEVAVIGGGRVTSARLWGATRNGAGVPLTYDWFNLQRIKNRLSYTISTNFSAMPLRREARVQLAYSPTEVNGTQTSFVLGGSNGGLAHVEVSALPDAVEAAQGLPAETRPLVSTESNKLTASEKAVLARNPILARSLFPGTVNGEVQPDHARVHFQAGETLRIAGNVDESVASRATIVVEEAPILANNALGHWYPKARLPVTADGGFAYDHEVQYGMSAVRVRLEVAAPAPAAASPMSLGATAPDQSVPQTPITLDYNAFGITTPPWQAPNHQGFDGSGNYYNSNYTGSGTDDPIPATPITYNGITFPLGPIPTKDGQVGGSGNSSSQNPPNFVKATGQTITVDMVDPSDDPDGVHARQHDFLYLAGAAANGDQLSQKITLTFTDGTTETWTQSFTDWSNNGNSALPQPYSGEFLIETQPERINQEGNLTPTPAYVFAYGYNLQGKQLASITLPDNENVGILSAVVAQSAAIQVGIVESQVLGHMNITGVDLLQVTIKNESNIGVGGGPLAFFLADTPETTATASTPAVYTQKQVTVPMGQQRTVTYVGPDSSSQLNFTVQKGDDTCVGPNCSTYLPDWNSGSGLGSSDRAASISPSLNSQIKSGQHWTMTIQNAGLGYYGYLDSPAGQNLPDGSGNTPDGARFQLMTEAEIKSQPEWARQLEEDIGAVVGLVIISAVTFGIADYALAGAAVAEEVGAEAAAEATAEVTAEAAAGEAIVDGGGEAVTEDLFTDSFVQEVYGPGEYALMGDDFSAISVVEDGGSLSSLVSTDGLGADVEVWAGGEWTSFESEVAVDVDAFEEPFIYEVDDVDYAGWRAGLAADAEADAQRAADRAVRDVFRNFF